MAILALLFVFLLVESLLNEQAQASGSSLAMDAWGQWNQAQQLLSEQPPDGFEQEAFPLSGRHELRSSQEICTIGYSFRGSPEQALDDFRESLQDFRWTETPSGREGCSTFVKSTGRYRWLFVQCVPMREWTCVVVNYSYQD